MALCERYGPYQSAVTQSASCSGAGLVLTMLMASSLLNCEALSFAYKRRNGTGSCHSSTFVAIVRNTSGERHPELTPTARRSSEKSQKAPPYRGGGR